jgi:3-dehydrosphinganine reductase
MILALLVVTLGVSFLILRRRKKPYFIASFAGKHVLITGASSGIGLALSKKSLQEGAFVTLVARNSAKLEQVAGSLLKDLQCSPDRILTKVADVGDYASIARVMEEALAWRPIDVLMCNAGVTQTGFFEDVKLKDINSIVQTNLLGTIYTVHASLPSLKQHSRTHPVSIVFIASLASLWLSYGSSVYTGTKHALKGIAESLALELLPFNMRVNLVCPGFTESPMLDDGMQLAPSRHQSLEL